MPCLIRAVYTGEASHEGDLLTLPDFPKLTLHVRWYRFHVVSAMLFHEMFPAFSNWRFDFHWILVTRSATELKAG